MSPGAGLNVEFTTKESWPDYTPPGWDGPLQYTVWAVVNVNGRWYTSGFIQMWRGPSEHGRADSVGICEELGVRLALGTDDGLPAARR